MPRKKNKYTLLKGSIITGVLLGVFFKAYEFFTTKQLWCGIVFPKSCEKDLLLYIKDLGLTILTSTIATVIIVYAGIYVIKYLINAAKNTKWSDVKKTFKSDSKTKKKETKTTKKETTKTEKQETKHEPDEIIRI